MNVTVRLFATLRQQAGWSNRVFDVPEGATVQLLMGRLDAEDPALAMTDRSVYAAVNQTYTTLEHTLAEGDEVAFFPPVSGGTLGWKSPYETQTV